MYDRDTPEQLIFEDTPYLGAKSEMYRNPMSVERHQRLLELLNNSKSNVILCGYDSDLYHAILRPPKWVLVKKIRIAQIGNSQYSEREMRVEHIWVKKSLGGMWDTI